MLLILRLVFIFFWWSWDNWDLLKDGYFSIEFERRFNISLKDFNRKLIIVVNLLYIF